ncbi:MAG: hypothetical protein AAFP82_23005, partial [Bacteroidota bacterium]
MKLKLLIIFLLLSSITLIQAQDFKPTRIVKVDPLALFASTISLRMEQVLNGEYSIQAGGSCVVKEP